MIAAVLMAKGHQSIEVIERLSDERRYFYFRHLVDFLTLENEQNSRPPK